VLFLDEPTVGIDPVGSRELRQTIKNLSSLGKTILLTTHYMAEAEELCHRIAIINKGRIVALDSPEALKRHISGDSVIEACIQPGHVQGILDLLRVLDGRTLVEVKNITEPETVSIRTPEPARVLELLSPYLNPQYIQGLEVRNQTLEDVYVTIIKAGGQ